MVAYLSYMAFVFRLFSIALFIMGISLLIKNQRKNAKQIKVDRQTANEKRGKIKNIT